jgi:ComF family protein
MPPYLLCHIADFAKRGVDLLFPPRCVHCGGELSPGGGNHFLCGDCSAKLGPQSWPGCRRCGALEAAEFVASPADCAVCRPIKLKFDGVIPLGSYDGVLREAVLKTKRPLHENMAVALADLLLGRRNEQLAEFRPDLIVPIPMHWQRRFRRGANSPDILAACLGRHLHVPVARRLLVRTRNTLPQKDLRPRERFKNVRGAFRLGNSGRWPLRDSRILLVDDILTTGATCSEAAGVLKHAGAVAVTAAVIAKAHAAH